MAINTCLLLLLLLVAGFLCKASDERLVSRIAFGSCSNQSSPQPIWKAIIDFDPQIFIWMGDNIYGDIRRPFKLFGKERTFGPWKNVQRFVPVSEEEMQIRYKKAKSNPGYSQLREKTQVIGTWDDHDYGLNDAGKEFSRKEINQRLLLDFLDEPQDSPRRKQAGVYASYTFGPKDKNIKVILLDTRYHRDPLFSDGSILGSSQWAWLEKELNDPTSTFTIIGSSIQMPKYAKFLKEVMPNKRKWVDGEMVKLNEEYSTILQKKLPPKLKDPGSFSIPCTIGNTEFEKALCDLGASINLMPYSIFEKLGLHELTSTTIILQLADRSIKYPRGIVEDVLVKVGNFIVPADFIVLDMEEDRTMPLILGRPFLATGDALIEVRKGLLTLRIIGEEVVFNVFKTMEHPNTIEHEIYAIDSIDVGATKVDTSKSEDMLKVALNNSPNQLQQAEQKFVLKSELQNLTSEPHSFEITIHNASLPPSHTKPLPSIVQVPIPGLNPPMKDERGKHRKLKTKWDGPFKGAKVFPHGAIEIHNDDGSTFKVISNLSATTGPLFYMESWGRFPKERDRLFKLIADSKRDGVFFISGDVHFGEISRYDCASRYPLYEITSSGLTQAVEKAVPQSLHFLVRVLAWLTPTTMRIIGPDCRYKSCTYGQPNFGAIEIDWNATPVTMKAEVRDVNGNTVTGINISSLELQSGEDDMVAKKSGEIQRHCSLEVNLPWIIRYRLAILFSGALMVLLFAFAVLMYTAVIVGQQCLHKCKLD